ncbi:MAG: twin-arginine translocase TatA/TatE family subunit [Marinilabiliaceae bacterium]|nr:twin-arginine translocase TatA/TatE family subunit [Marinilabiliaceae bacterium]
MVIFLFGLSGGEILVIFLVILILFGSDKLPGLARTIGKGMNEFKKASEDIKREIRTSASEMKEDIIEARRTVREDVNKKNDNIDDVLDNDPYGLNEEEKENNDV